MQLIISSFIKLMILCLSLGLDEATKIVKVARVVFNINCFPFLFSTLFLSRKYKNIVAAILLFPSA